MKLNLILKMLPIEVILALELTTNQNVIKWQDKMAIFRVYLQNLHLYLNQNKNDTGNAST